jgi:thioredoxin 2
MHTEVEALPAMQLDDRGVLMPCPSCGTVNRRPYQALERTARCGRCRTTLAPPATPLEVRGPAAFDALVSRSSIPIIVDFWAPWCGPCRTMAPELAKVAQRMAGEVLVVKVNTDAEPELAERFRIRSIPTIAVFRDGREITRAAGARPASAIEALVSTRTHA